MPLLTRRAHGVLRAGAGLLLRELLGRVKATVMGAVANAEVPMERALAAAGVPEDLWARAATRCVVHDEGFFKVSDSMGGFEVRVAHPVPSCARPASQVAVAYKVWLVGFKVDLLFSLHACVFLKRNNAELSTEHQTSDGSMCAA